MVVSLSVAQTKDNIKKAVLTIGGVTIGEKKVVKKKEIIEEDDDERKTDNDDYVAFSLKEMEDAIKFVNDTSAVDAKKVHIHAKRRKGKKYTSSVINLAEDLDLKRMLSSLKKTLKCNGAVVEHETFGKVIQLQGDHRLQICDFLVEQEICRKDEIVVHMKM